MSKPHSERLHGSFSAQKDATEAFGWVGRAPVKTFTGKASQAKVVFGVFRGGMNEFCQFQLQERRLSVYTGPGARCGCVWVCSRPVVC